MPNNVARPGLFGFSLIIIALGIIGVVAAQNGTATYNTTNSYNITLGLNGTAANTTLSTYMNVSIGQVNVSTYVPVVLNGTTVDEFINFSFTPAPVIINFTISPAFVANVSADLQTYLNQSFEGKFNASEHALSYARANGPAHNLSFQSVSGSGGYSGGISIGPGSLNVGIDAGGSITGASNNIEASASGSLQPIVIQMAIPPDLAPAIAAAIAAGMQSSLQNSTNAALAASLPQILSELNVSPSVAASLEASLPGALGSSNFSAGLSNAVASVIASNLPAIISQSLPVIGPAIGSAVNTALSQGLSAGLTQALPGVLASTTDYINSQVNLGVPVTPSEISGFLMGNLSTSLEPFMEGVVGAQLDSQLSSLGIQTALGPAIVQALATNNFNNQLNQQLELTVLGNLAPQLSSVLAGALGPTLGNAVASTLTSYLATGLTQSFTPALATLLSQNLALDFAQQFSSFFPSSVAPIISQLAVAAITNQFGQNTLANAIGSYFGVSITGPITDAQLANVVLNTIPGLAQMLPPGITTGFIAALIGGQASPAQILAYLGTTPYGPYTTLLSGFLGIGSPTPAQFADAIASIIGGQAGQYVFIVANIALNPTPSNIEGVVVQFIVPLIGNSPIGLAAISGINAGLTASIAGATTAAISKAVGVAVLQSLVQNIPGLSAFVSTPYGAIIYQLAIQAIEGSLQNFLSGAGGVGGIGSSLGNALGGLQNVLNQISLIQNTLSCLAGCSVVVPLGPITFTTTYKGYTPGASTGSNTSSGGLVGNNILSGGPSGNVTVAEGKSKIPATIETYQQPAGTVQGTSTSGSSLTGTTTTVTSQVGSGSGSTVFGGSGLTSSSSTGSPADYSPTNQVFNDNQQSSKSWLTCPAQPPSQGPTTDILFYPNHGTFVAGDWCLSQAGSLTTEIYLTTTVKVPSSLIIAPTVLAVAASPKTFLAWSTVNPLVVINPGEVVTQVAAYSPTVDGDLSNGFNTNSYIFKSVPSLAQHAIWGWWAYIANFKNAKVPKSQSYSRSGILLGIAGFPPPFPLLCYYTYTYSETTTLEKINNNYIPFVEYTGKTASPIGGAPGSGLVTAPTPIVKSVPATTTGQSPSTGGAVCPNKDYTPTTKIPSALTNQELYACAEGAGFSGTAVYVIAAIAKAESAAYPGRLENCAGNVGLDPNCAGEGLVQIDWSQHASLELSNFNGGSTVYWSTCQSEDPGAPAFAKCPYNELAFNPYYAMEWAYGFSNDGTYFGGNGCDKWCSYSGGQYCQFMPSWYSGPHCRGGGGVTGPVAITPPVTPTYNYPACTQCLAFNSIIYPYLLFNYSLTMPSAATVSNPNMSGMNEDVFSPWNYYNPYNTLETFPIDLPSVLFANYTGKDSKDLLTNIPENGFGINTNSANAVPLTYFESNGQPPSNIIDPISIAITPNNYAYVLFGVKGNSGLFCSKSCFSGHNWFIAVIRIIPHGYYNVSNIQLPKNADCAKGTEAAGCQPAWNAEWDNYWVNVLGVQNGTAYPIQILSVSSLLSKGFRQHTIFGIIPTGTTNQEVIPYNISADNTGDLFMIGSDATFTQNLETLILGNGLSVKTEIFRISNTVGGGPITIAENAISVLGNLGAGYTEIAASPELGNVYAASPGSGCISVFSGKTLGFITSIPLAFGFYPGGAVPGVSTTFNIPTGLGCSEPSGQVNIGQWLNSGGLFGTKQSVSVDAVAQDMDVWQNHHPIAISDVNGYLYVLDDWAGSLQGGTQFNILDLREINSTGIDVPINPTLFNDLYVGAQCSILSITPSSASTGVGSTQSQCIPDNQQQPVVKCNSACKVQTSSCPTGIFVSEHGYTEPGSQYTCISGDGSTSYYSPSVPIVPSAEQFQNTTYPPFGWILSANIGGTTFCAVDCGYNPGTYTSGYYPVGPQLPAQPTGPSWWDTVLHGLPVGGIGGSGLGPGGVIVSPGASASVGFSVDSNGTAAIFFPKNNNFQATELLFGRIGDQNYTKWQQDTPVFTCYTQSGGSQCQSYPNINNMHPPIALLEDPFANLENQGSQKIFSYANQYSNEYTGGSGSPTSAAEQQGYTQQCLNELATLSTPTNCKGSGTSISISIKNILSGFGASQAIPSASGSVNVPILVSYVGGKMLVGYNYIYKLTQQWTNFNPITPGCPPIPSALTSALSALANSENTVYSFAPTPPAVIAGVGVAGISGGASYLQYEGDKHGAYYIQNLSDMGLYLSQHILFNLTTSREVGEAYVAMQGPGSKTTGTPKPLLLLTATQILKYVITTQNLGTLSYQQIFSEGVGGLDLNSLTGAAPSGVYGDKYVPSYVSQHLSNANIPANFIFQENETAGSHFSVILFDWYKQEVYESPLDLYVPNTLGYQRILYAFNDKFNNTIYAPLDADIAHLTSINVNMSTNVSVTNPNQTQLYIRGQAGEYEYNALGIQGNFIPLVGNSIYIYFNNNINYVGLTKEQVQLCAFGSPAYPFNTIPFPSSCTLANPVWTGLTQGAGTINYRTAGTGASCPMPPNSLLYNAPTNCNIYGQDNLGHKITTQCAGSETCVPIYANGTGQCTGEVGLMGIAQTNANGIFSFNTLACGIGQEKIIAQYYGTPPPQPIQPEQASLPSSANDVIPGTSVYSASYPAFNAVNYSWVPNQTTTLIEIGLFELSFGDITAIALVLAVGVIVFLLLFKSTREKSAGSKRKRG